MSDIPLTPKPQTLSEHIAAMNSRDVVLEQVTFRQGITLFEMFGVLALVTTQSKETNQ